MLKKVFGEKLKDVIYHDRVAAYVVLIDNDRIAAVKTASGKVFLPGGKVEVGESSEECVIRECLEEIGAKIELKQYFAMGERYFFHEASGRYSHSIGHFFYSDKYEIICEPTEKDEMLLWLSFDEAKEKFYHPHHKWAIECIWSCR